MLARQVVEVLGVDFAQDILWIGTTIAFFVIAIGYVRLYDRIR